MRSSTVRRRTIVSLTAASLAVLPSCRPGDATTAVGTLEVTQVDLAPLVPARVIRVLVDEGDPIRPGDTVAVLSQAGLPDQVAEANARLAAAEAQLLEHERGSRPEEITKAEQDLAGATAFAEQMRLDVVRARTLASTQVISRQQLEQAEARYTEATARKSALAEQLALVREGARPEKRAAARAEVARARAARDGVQATVGDLVLVSPVSGVVLVRAAEPGEVLPAGVPAITVGDELRPWVRVYVGQGVLPTLKLGDTVMAELDDFPDRAFPGEIVALATKAEFTPRVALTERERADLLFGVKVQFVDTTAMLKPGVPVTVSFRGSRTAD
jgi:HlyD family secretion protein